MTLGEMAGQLGKGLVGADAYAHGHAYALDDAAVQVLPPPFQVHAVHSVQIDEAFINTVAEVCGSLLTDYIHHAAGELGIKLIVGREDGYLPVRKLLLQFEIRHAGLDAEGLGLVAAGNHAAVVVAEHNHGPPLQVRTEDTLTGDVAVVAVDYAVHFMNGESPSTRA